MSSSTNEEKAMGTGRRTAFRELNQQPTDPTTKGTIRNGVAYYGPKTENRRPRAGVSCPSHIYFLTSTIKPAISIFELGYSIGYKTSLNNDIRFKQHSKPALFNY